MDFQISLFETVATSVLCAGMVSMFIMLWRFIKEQREVNEKHKQFICSMQLAEMTRYFRIVVEQRNPVSVEEMQHLQSCYEAYHGGGNNGVGTLMYEKIRDHAIIKTGASDGKA